MMLNYIYTYFITLHTYFENQYSVNVGPIRAAWRVKILFFGMLIMHGGFFLRNVTFLATVIGHKATPKKCGAMKDKLFPAFISQRSAACSVALQWWGRSFKRGSPSKRDACIYLIGF